MKFEDIDNLVTKLKEHLSSIGKERDKIDDTLDDLQALKEDCDNAEQYIFDAITSLDSARDALSELV